MIREIFQGFCMAMADSVPGVSGGSIAFLMGFYEKFITSLNDLTSLNREKTKAALMYLGKLGIGWVAGMLAAVTVLAAVFESRIYDVSSLFLGFVVMATCTMFLDPQIRKVTVSGILCFLAGLVLVVAVTRMNGASGIAVDLAQLTPVNAAYVFFAAMFAISAMVLPGISGSTLLLVFGLYIPVITAIKNLLHFDFSCFLALVVFGCGVLTGIICFVRWIKLALEKFPVQTRYAIIGLMVGSFYAIIMGPTTLKVPLQPMTLSMFNVGFFAAGAGIVLLLEH